MKRKVWSVMRIYKKIYIKTKDSFPYHRVMSTLVFRLRWFRMLEIYQALAITVLCRRSLISQISISRLPWISKSWLEVPNTASLCNAGGLNIKKYWIILKVLEFVVMRLDCTKYFLINKAFCKTLMQVYYMYVGDIRDLWCSGFASGCWLESKNNHINII